MVCPGGSPLAVGNARLYAAEQAARRAAEGSAAKAALLLTDLEVQRNRFEAIIRNLPSGVIVAEVPSGRTMISNEALEKILGTSDLSPKRRGDLRIFAADGRPLARRDCRRRERSDGRADPNGGVWSCHGRQRRLDRGPVGAHHVGRWQVCGGRGLEDITDRHRQVHTAFLAESSAILAPRSTTRTRSPTWPALVVPTIAD
jgi:PAS domain-containing protein